MTKTVGSQLILAPFPRDGLDWQIVAHGRVRAPTEVDESACEVFLAEAGWDRPSWTLPSPARSRSIWLGVGQLPLTPVGSIWRDGVCSSTSTRQQKRIEVVGASKKWPVDPLGKMVAYQPGPRAPWTPAYPIGDGGDLPLFRVTTNDGGALWVPALELARAVFGVTSQWLRLMIEGGMRVWPELRGRIIDPTRSGRNHDLKSLKLWAYRGLDDLDILAAARICADRDLRLCFDGVADGLRRHGIGRAPTHVRMPFPFGRPSTWTIEECWTGAEHADGHVMKRRLITRIVDIDYELGLDRVQVFYPGQVETDDDEAPNEAGSQRLRLRAKGDVSDDVKVITGQASWSPLGVMKKPSANSRAASAWVVEHIPVDPEEPTAGKTKVVPLDGLIRAATTAGHGTRSERGGRLAIKLNIKDKVQAKMDVARPPLTRVASTIAALHRLADDLGRPLEQVRPGDMPGADIIDGLWRYPTDDGAGFVRWATTKEGRQRRALVARLERDRGWIYFFEAEHLEIEGTETGQTGRPDVVGQDGYTSLCLLAPLGFDLLSADMIGDLLRANAASRGVWRRPALAVPMTTVRRNNAWLHDHGAYARAIGRAIQRLEVGPEQLLP